MLNRYSESLQKVSSSSLHDNVCVETVEKKIYASFLGYQNGDEGPDFLYKPSLPVVNFSNWPQWTDTLSLKGNDVRDEGGARTTGSLKFGNSEIPLISYVTVVKNNQETIERAILSVKNQTYNNVEHIILDGASTDKTLQIIKKYSDSIDYYVSEPDSGLYDALNKAISLARGQLICILNSDDWLEPNASQIAVERVKDYDEPKMLFCAAKVADKGIVHHWRPSVVHPGSYFMCANTCHNAIYATRRAYELSGPYDSTYRIAGDFKWIMRSLDVGVRFFYTDETSVNYSLGGVSGNFMNHSLECMRVAQEKFTDLNQAEVRGLYHCFFIFSNAEIKFESDIPGSYTRFIQETIVNHSDDHALLMAISWASIIKLNHPNDLLLFHFQKRSYRFRLKLIKLLKTNPRIYNFVRRLKNYFLKI